MPWLNLALLALSVAISVSLAPKPPARRPQSLSEGDIPTAEEGRPIPVVFGTYTIKSSNIVWYGDIRYSEVTTKAGK